MARTRARRRPTRSASAIHRRRTCGSPPGAGARLRLSKSPPRRSGQRRLCRDERAGAVEGNSTRHSIALVADGIGDGVSGRRARNGNGREVPRRGDFIRADGSSPSLWCEGFGQRRVAEERDGDDPVLGDGQHRHAVGLAANHATAAGWPLASVATIRHAPAVPIDGVAKARHASRPAYQVREPTGSMAASARSTSRKASASDASHAAIYPASSSRARGEVASSTSSRPAPPRRAAPWPAAGRSSPRYTDMPSASPVSAAEKASTSCNSRTARCRGARCCNPATKASRTLSRAVTRSAGSVGNGSSHGPRSP